MRLLIGMPDPGSLGGPAACEPPFVTELIRQGVEIHEETYVYGEKLKPTMLANRVLRVLGAAVRLRRKLAAGDFDLLHINTSFDARALLRDYVTVALLPRRTAKIFIKFHGSDADLLLTPNVFLKHFASTLRRRANGIGVLSSEEKRNFVRAGWDENKMFVVKNVVDRDLPEPSRTFALRNALPEVQPVLLFIARFIPAKGLLDVIRASALLRKRGIKHLLLCVGDGPARFEAEREAEMLGIGDAVRFVGLVPESDTAEFYANSTILVFPTYHYEGFPMSIFYSLKAGVPVITTRIRAAADYLAEPDNCLWVEPRNPEMLAERIEFLLNDQSLLKAMGERNRILANEFSAARVVREYLEAYREIIERH